MNHRFICHITDITINAAADIAAELPLDTILVACALTSAIPSKAKLLRDTSLVTAPAILE